MKFEEAYCKYECRTIPIYEVSEIYQNRELDYASSYKDSFLCPECKEVQLVYNNGVTPYFSTYPNASHHPDCSLQQDLMTKKQTELFASDDGNKKKITRQINSLMHLLLSEIKSDAHASVKRGSFSRSFTSTHPHDATGKKLFPRKRIDAPFGEEDYNSNKFFYGDVNLTWEKNEERNRYQIILRSMRNNKFICTMSVSENVYVHIPSEYKDNVPYNCKIVFLAVIEKTKKNYKKTSLKWSGFLDIHRL